MQGAHGLHTAAGRYGNENILSEFFNVPADAVKQLKKFEDNFSKAI